MADATSAAAIQARMDEIMGQLCATGFTSSPVDQERRSELERQYAALASRLPSSGVDSGSFIEINGRLGAGFEVPPAPRSRAMSDEVRADPILRHLHETGQLEDE